MQQRQCVCVHVGQCGVQIGNAIWELFCIEHGINPDGTVQSDKISVNSLTESSKTFFLPIMVDAKEEKQMEKAIPRVVMVDLEPTVLDEIRVGKYRDLYHPDQLISGKEDAANNYARGHNTVGKDILENVQDSIKKVVEQCDSLQGFILFHSGGGGTGSGFGSLLFENMANTYAKKTRLEILVHPAPKVSSSVVEPYNFVLSTHSLLNSDYSNCTFVVDNEALYDICQKKLDIERPSYPTLNRMLAQIVSSMTASLRFDGVLNVDLSEFHVNLVPFPRLRFPMTSYSPIISHAKVNHEQLGIHDITSECFSKANQLVKCDITNGKFLACCLLYRGDIAPKDIKSAINTIRSRKNIRFVEWCPTGFKIGINRQKPSTFPSKELAEVRRAVCLLANTTAVTDIWTELGKKFDLLFSKKAFIHWFLTEGMDEEQFLESRSHFEMVKLDYLEVQKESNALFKPRECEI